MTKLIIYTDGAARGNPGPAGAGVVIKDAGLKIVKELWDYLGETTNNQAEYRALIIALKSAAELGAGELDIFADSELMVSQLKGLYKVKNEGLIPLFNEAVGLFKKFKSCRISHVPREKNKEADRLANKAIDDYNK